MSDARSAVVAGHGAFADGLLSAVTQVVGPMHHLVGVSNADASPEALRTALEAALDRSGAATIFTDLPAGSCTMAARRIARTRPGLTVVTGASLPLLLAFVTGAPLDAAVRAGRDALAIAEGGA